MLATNLSLNIFILCIWILLMQTEVSRCQLCDWKSRETQCNPGQICIKNAYVRIENYPIYMCFNAMPCTSDNQCKIKPDDINVILDMSSSLHYHDCISGYCQAVYITMTVYLDTVNQPSACLKGN